MKSSQRGGGPQTAAGKINSSQNAVKHGITSNKMYVLQNENPAAWAELLDICVEQFRPTNRYERTIVEEIACQMAPPPHVDHRDWSYGRRDG